MLDVGNTAGMFNEPSGSSGEIFLPETLIRGISPKLIKTLDIKSMERVGMFSMAWAGVPLKY